VCLQNSFNIANRADEAVLAATTEQHIADVPYFPPASRRCGAEVGRQVARRDVDGGRQSWLLQHSPNIMLIPGTPSVAHLRENIAGAAPALPPDAAAEMDAM
jgi:aryl-alcohol dehydrogenase-like predicted oxidoreductase